MRKTSLAIPITFEVPFLVGSMNIYLFCAEPLTLVDTGPKTAIAREAVNNTLQAHGCCPQDLKRIVITHGHIDHFGLAAELARASGAAIYIHPYDAYKLRAGYSFITEKLPMLRQADVPEEQLKELETWSRRAQKLSDPLEEVYSLQDGGQISFDSFSLKVIHCPGHSQGHICLYSEERSELWGGDHILQNITPNPAIEPSPSAPEERSRSLVQYLDSLAKIERLDLRCIFPAHGPLIHAPRKRIMDIQRHHLRRKEKIRGLLNRRGSSAYELAVKLFGLPREMDVFLIVSEILAHLDLLMQEEQAITQERDGVVYYSAP